MSSNDQQNDLAAKLIGELKDLSLPNLQETLQELLGDPEIGITLRQLTDGELADERPPEIETRISLECRRKEDLETAKSDYEAKLQLLMRERVFGQAEPSVGGFLAYLEQLTKLAPTTYEEKKSICKTVNYWKLRFHVDILHDGTACTVKAVSTRSGLGAFQLRATGIGQESLGKGGLMFPSLSIQIRPVDQAGPVLAPLQRPSGGVEVAAPLAGREILYRFNQTTSKDLVNRLQERMSLGEIARSLGRDTGYVSRIASGKRQPGEGILIAIRQLAISKGLFEIALENPRRDHVIDTALRPPAPKKVSAEIDAVATSNGIGTKLRPQEMALEYTQRELEDKLNLAMVERIFGHNAPSLANFQAYLNKVARSEMELNGEPSLIVRTINYCRQLPGVEAD